MEQYPKCKYHGYFMLSKDNDNNELYISCYSGFLNKEFIKEFVNLNSKIIMKIFHIFNDMNEKFGIKVNELDKFFRELNGIVSADSLYKLEIYCDGNIDEIASLKLNDSESQQILTREWVNKLSLYNFMLENENVLLRKIPVVINSLDSILQRIVHEYYKDKNKQLTK